MTWLCEMEKAGVAIERDSDNDKRAFEAFNSSISIGKKGRRREGPGRKSAVKVIPKQEPCLAMGSTRP